MSNKVDEVSQKFKKRLSTIVQHLETLSDTYSGEAPFEQIFSRIQTLQECTRSTTVGFFAPSGAGKSTLINSMLGVNILETGGGGRSVTQSLIKVRNISSTLLAEGKGFRVTVKFLNSSELGDLMGIDENDDSNQVEIATEVRKKLWGTQETPNESNGWVPERYQDEVNDGEMVREFDDAEEVEEYLQEQFQDNAKCYLVKEVEIEGCFPHLDEQLCLMDIPGGGHTSFLNQLMFRGVELCDVVVCVATSARCLNFVEDIKKHASLFENKLKLAFCVTRSGDSGVKRSYEKLVKPKKIKMQDGDATTVVPSKTYKGNFIADRKADIRAEFENLGLSLRLPNVESFILEEENCELSEQFQEQRSKFRDFLSSTLKTEDVWEILEGKLDQLVAKVDEDPKPISLSQAELFDILHGISPVEYPVLSSEQLVRAPNHPVPTISQVSSWRHYRSTLKDPNFPDRLKYSPPIPVWKEVISASLNMPEVVEHMRDFQNRWIQEVKARTTKVGMMWQDVRRRNQLLRAVDGVVFEHIKEKFENSMQFVQLRDMENELIRKFWPKVPEFAKGKGSMTSNQKSLNLLLTSQFPDMRVLVKKMFLERFCTLEEAFESAVTLLKEKPEVLEKQYISSPSDLRMALLQAFKAEEDESETANNDKFQYLVAALSERCQSLSKGKCKRINRGGLRKRKFSVSNATVELRQMENTSDPAGLPYKVVLVVGGKVERMDGGMGKKATKEWDRAKVVATVHSRSSTLLLRTMNALFKSPDMGSIRHSSGMACTNVKIPEAVFLEVSKFVEECVEKSNA